MVGWTGHKGFVEIADAASPPTPWERPATSGSAGPFGEGLEQRSDLLGLLRDSRPADSGEHCRRCHPC